MSRKFLSSYQPPKGTTLPSWGTQGDHFYKTDTKELYIHDGTTWTVVGGGGGASVTVSDTPPSSPTTGNIWYESDSGKQFVYYDSYWVEIGSGIIGPTGPAGPNVFQSSGNLYGIPGALAISATTNLTTANTIYYMPFMNLKQITISEIGGRVTVQGSAGAKCRIAIYNSGSNWSPGSLIADIGEIAVDSTGFKSISALNLTLAPGAYLLRLHSDGAATQATFGVHRSAGIWGSIGTSNTDQWVFMTTASRTYGVAEDPGQTATFGNTGTSTSSGYYYHLRMKWDI